MDPKLSKHKLERLYKAILTLENVEECDQFFSDLCTVSELMAMEQRFHVATLLDRQYVYSDIVRETGASTATISRVNRTLGYGEGGYKTVIARLGESENGYPEEDEDA